LLLWEVIYVIVSLRFCRDRGDNVVKMV